MFRLTILSDNKALPELEKEHGFSCFIEAEGTRIVFDTGQNKTMEINAPKLGIDLTSADILALSHGHYDHTGGIGYLLSVNKKLTVYSHTDIFTPRYSIPDRETVRNISMKSENGKALIRHGSALTRWIYKPTLLSPRAGITGTVPRIHPLEDTGGPFYLDPEGLNPDPLNDDMSLWFHTKKGLIIVTGCCHSGLINTVGYIRKITGVENVYGIIGGFHLNRASSERLTETIRFLKDLSPKLLVPCHCTGEEAAAVMKQNLGDIVTEGYAGYRLEEK